MTDIVERLRNSPEKALGGLGLDAADEIERLREVSNKLGERLFAQNDEIERLRAALAWLENLEPMTERDLDSQPYSEDEQRVADFLYQAGAGGGNDPIGFILASHAYLAADRNELRTEIERLRAQLKAEKYDYGRLYEVMQAEIDTLMAANDIELLRAEVEYWKGLTPLAIQRDFPFKPPPAEPTA